MSPLSDPHEIEDLTHSCGGGDMIFNPASLMDSGRDLSQYMYINPEGSQLGAYFPSTTEFLPATSTQHNVGPAFQQQRGSSLGFDLSSSYASGPYGYYPLQNGFVPSNAFYSMQGSQHIQPTLPYTQQQQQQLLLLPYSSTQYPNTCANEELAQDDPFSVYPPLNDGNNAPPSLPYGDWVIRQGQKCLPPIPNPQPVNAGYATDGQYHQPDNNAQTEIPQNSTKKGEGERKVVRMSRAAQKLPDWDPEYEVRSVYPIIKTRVSWGSRTWEGGQYLFSYDDLGRWKRDRCFNNEQLREYVDNCPKGTVFRVQQAPTQCNWRMTAGDRMCRWANCPVANKTISSGWLRLTFDEFLEETSNGERNPYECAGSMHLWCFEQAFNLVEFYMDKRLVPEKRVLLCEERNAAALEKLTDVGLVDNVWTPWFENEMAYFKEHGKFRKIQRYEDSLSYALTKWHVDNQTRARAKARDTRHDAKNKDNKEPRRTIDVHMGNLLLYVMLTNQAKHAKRAHDEQKRERGHDQPDRGPDSPATSEAGRPSSSARRAQNHGRNASTTSSAEPSPRRPSSQQRPSASGSDKECRRRRKEHKRRALATQSPAGQGQDLGLNTFSAATADLNPSPLDPACSETKAPSDHGQESPANAYTSIYPPAMPGPEFSTFVEEPTEPGHALEPPFWEYQQPPQLSGTAALPYSTMEHQPVPQDSQLDILLQVSPGDLLEFGQSETKDWARNAEGEEEAPHVLGYNDGTSFNDSDPFHGLNPEEANLFVAYPELLDPTNPYMYLAEGSAGALDSFTAQTQTSQPLEACTESPHVAAGTGPCYGEWDYPTLPLFEEFGDGSNGEV
ncbi:hypothetical protein ACQKWADRAFT_314382 [Trichoderma austrokoningii]